MNSKMNAQQQGWGVFLITMGVASLLDLYTAFSDWIKLGVILTGAVLSLVLYFIHEKDWQLLVPAYVMACISIVGAVGLMNILSGDFLAVLALLLAALPFAYVYIKDTKQWWALIPGYVLFAIALMVFLMGMQLLSGRWVAPYVLLSIALPFMVVYLKDHQNWWALIPAYTMVMVAGMVLLIEFQLLTDLMIPSYIMLAIGLPFFYVYFQDRANWWALIPAGIMSLIAAGFAISTPMGQFIIPMVLILIGAAMVFRKR